jgi:hypothetical protein
MQSVRELEHELTGFDLRQVKHIIDESEQMPAVGLKSASARSTIAPRSAAHELGHFVAHYLEPRELAFERFGPGIRNPALSYCVGPRDTNQCRTWAMDSATSQSAGDPVAYWPSSSSC